MATDNNDLALVLSGGGARAAYQVGFLRCLAKHIPDLNIPILTGVSAGAINAAFLANHQGAFSEAVTDLGKMWCGLTTEQVFCADAWTLTKNVACWGTSLLCGGHGLPPAPRSLVDTSPLQQLLQSQVAPHGGILTGVTENLRQGKLKALAITGTNYGTGQAVTWIQGKEITLWERPYRRSVATEMSIDHIMASAALPLFFPAVQVGNSWFGDGGLRQSSPLSPALHLGARRIMAISTRYERSIAEADEPVIHGYPPMVQIIGTLMNSVFLDRLDQDARSLEQVNQLIKRIPEDDQPGPLPVNLAVLRPSCDIGKLSSHYEHDLPRLFRYLGRGIGTHKTGSPDWLSMVLFEPRYLQQLLSLGEADAEARMSDIHTLLKQP